MRGFTNHQKSYFDKFSDKPVKIFPFDPRARIVAEKYIKKIESLLNNFEVEVLHRGSTAFGISGKGEIEIGIYPKQDGWEEVVRILKKHFGKVDNLEENYARFNDKFMNFEIEVILLRGHDATVDKKLTEYLKKSPGDLKDYEKVKRKYSFSKREYMVQKNKFLQRIVNKLH